jgi:hypothetical protein
MPPKHPVVTAQDSLPRPDLSSSPSNCAPRRRSVAATTSPARLRNRDSGNSLGARISSPPINFGLLGGITQARAAPLPPAGVGLEPRPARGLAGPACTAASGRIQWTLQPSPPIRGRLTRLAACTPESKPCDRGHPQRRSIRTGPRVQQRLPAAHDMRKRWAIAPPYRPALLPGVLAQSRPMEMPVTAAG